jgi:predicted P-loop ATPase
MDKREKPAFYTDKEWAEYLRQHPNLDDKGGGGQREKPDYFTDEEWAEFLREHPDFDDKVVRLDKTKRKGKKPPPPGGWPPWFAELRTDERGRVYPDLRNVLIALRREPQTCSAFHFDEMAQDPIVAAPPPLAPDAKPSPPPPRQVTDDDVSRLQEWLQHVGLPRIGRDTVRQAVEALAREHRFHPIRDWLDSLVWDRVPRLGSWLHDCLETPDDDYHRRVGQMFLIAMVARIYQPGCKADYMIVLEGPQGEEKSKFCRAVAGGDAFFSEHLPRIDRDQVRLSMHLKGKWLIEVAELAAMLKADPEGVKHFISQQIEKYIPKYGRCEVIEPRQCLFIGTTNEDDYIADVTGGRRYWPVAVVAVNLDALAAIRDQLFAEAVHCYHNKERWWPTREFEKEHIAPLQNERQWEDALSEAVLKVIDPRDKDGKPPPPTIDEDGKPIEPPSEITMADLGSRIGFGVDPTKFDQRAQKRVAKILKKAKWWRGSKHGGGNIWRKPPKW